MILKLLSKYIYPKEYNKSIFMIDFNKLYEVGYKLLLFDLDNTIASYNEIIPSNEVIELFKELNKKFKIIIISNSNKKRVRPFANALNVDYKASCLKPLVYKVKSKLKKYKNEKVVLIGDQLLTDMVVANRLGFYPIIVDAINKKTEYKRTRFNRKIERKVIRYSKKRDINKYNNALKEYVGELND